MTQAAVAKYGSAAIPEAEHRIEPTSQSRLDEALAILQDHKKEWAALDVDERIDLLEELRDGVMQVAERWVDASVEAKGLTAGSAQEADEWLGGVSLVVRNLSLLIDSLRDVAKHGAPQLPKPAFKRPDGQVVAPVFPTDMWDALLFQGFTAEVWMDPEVELDDLPNQQAEFYRAPSHTGRVALVLGAGNVSSIGAMDVLYKMFVEGEVVILKMNPVNEYLGPILDEAFAPLRERGYFRVVYGGAAEGGVSLSAPSRRGDSYHRLRQDPRRDRIRGRRGRRAPKGEPRAPQHQAHHERARQRHPNHHRPRPLVQG